jgi:phage repressor protein C with HTH and peptisase S24 domain
MDLDPTRVAVLKLLVDRNTDLKNASLAIGKNAAYMHQYVYRGTPKVLPEEVREALANYLEVDQEQLRPREKARRPAPSLPASRAASPPRLDVEGFASVTEIDVRASAGPGALNEGLEEMKGTWLFPDPVIRHEFRTKPEYLHIITIDGDSMAPLLASGDRILIDTNQRVPVPPGIFVIWDGMGLVAKRVEHIPNSDPTVVIIKSVNPEYQTYERTADEVNIIGRVIWAAKRL